MTGVQTCALPIWVGDVEQLDLRDHAGGITARDEAPAPTGEPASKDYAVEVEGPAARVIAPTAEGPRPVPIRDLLPWKYQRPGSGA